MMKGYYAEYCTHRGIVCDISFSLTNGIFVPNDVSHPGG